YITYGREVSIRQSALLRKLTSKLCSRLIVLGRVPYEKLVSLYELTWTTLFPSIYEEPLPYAIMESCLLGTVPIASRVGGVPEIVEGTYAEKLLFRPSDVNDLIRKVEDVLALSKEELMNISIELKETTQRRFDAERIRNCLSRVFLSLAEG
ncbi:MAG: hypothetical protein DRZ82_10110, partial [Thermoprotei archaeon]